MTSESPQVQSLRRYTESEERKTFLNRRVAKQKFEACCGLHAEHIPAAVKKKACVYATTHTVYASQTDNACSRLFAVPSLWTVTHQLNLSPLPFPCASSHLPSPSLPNKGVTKMTKDSTQNKMRHEAQKSTRIQFHIKTNIIYGSLSGSSLGKSSAEQRRATR